MPTRKQPAQRLLAVFFLVACVIGLVIAVWAFVAEASGVSGTFGAGLVVVSTGLLIAAGAILGFWTRLGRGWRTTFEVLIVLGLLGTIFAAWLLMEWMLVGATAAAIVVDVLRLAWPAPSPRPA